MCAGVIPELNGYGGVLMFTCFLRSVFLLGGTIGIFILTIKFLGNIAGVILGIFLVIIYWGIFAIFGD